MLDPFAMRLLAPRLARSGQQSLSQTRLVPGGRFLVTSAVSGLLCLWDLGYGPSSLINPYPLASTTLPHEPFVLLLQAAEREGVARVVVCHRLSGVAIDITAFEVELGPTHEFKKIGEYRVPAHNLHAYALTPNRFTFHYNMVVTVWDFMEDICVTINVHTVYSSILVSPTTIICQDSRGQWLFDIPPLQPTDSPLARETVNSFYPSMAVSHITGIFDSEIELTRQADWLLAPPNSQVVFDVYGERDGDIAFVACVFHLMAAPDAGLPRALPRLMGVSSADVPEEQMGFFDPRPLQHAQNAQRDLIRTWLLQTDIVVSVAPLPAEPEELVPASSASVFSLESAGVRRNQLRSYDMDALSGRLVVATSAEVRVLDFLVPNQAY
ncbi:F-box domain-containing protein [Mycena indigotica]|uniref:F-box domain-containing protein n=1 Tax=Mycena indigotica TaxID=2126181 RepID=A0A8H6TEQ8_9AGAR|nr:F-box domain-containing protein [Mycena indigotica]KAF7316140.1 F-box domain-containing protein [Mycena indigotica]